MPKKVSTDITHKIMGLWSEELLKDKKRFKSFVGIKNTKKTRVKTFISLKIHWLKYSDHFEKR